MNASRFNISPSKTVREVSVATCGAEIAETAIILPLLFVIVLGIFWVGQAYRIYGAVTHAAREGARAAVVPLCATCSSTNDPTANAWAAVQSAMNAASLDPNVLQQPTTLPPVCGCGSTTTQCVATPVQCDSGQGNICVQGVSRTQGNPLVESNVQLSAPINGAAGECGLSVSFQYPFSLALPFSPLSNQTINIRAQSQMRVETQ